MTDSADGILGPPVLVWRDDPLFNQGHIAAELALAILRKLETDVHPWVLQEHDADIVHAIDHLEAFVAAARAEAAERAK